MRATLRAAGNWPATNSARTQAQRLALVRLMQLRSPAARRVSDRHLRHLARDFLHAGWSARELLHALDYQPDGTPHPYAYHAADLRVPAGWLAHRWQFWRAADGTPLPGYRQAKHHTARAPRPAAAQPNPHSDPHPAPAPAPAAGSPLSDVTRDRALRAQVRADRHAREAANRDRQLQAHEPAPAGPAGAAARNHSAVIRARALARARQERAAHTTPTNESRTK